MSEDRVAENITKAMDPDTFDVLDYLDEQPVAVEDITIYVNVPKSRRLHKVVAEREEELKKRAKDAQRGKTDSLSLVDDEAETEYDDEINELVTELERTALKFKVQSVAPSLIKAIEKHYAATEPKDNAVELEAHNRKGNADILSRAIKSVVKGDGVEDTKEWDAERLMKLEDKLYPEQAARLISALFDMVNTGYAFEEALTADF